MDYLIYYLIAISFVSAITACYDKIASKRFQRNRVPEAFLIFLSAIGGSAVMFLIMLLIRHKTRHLKFMIGLPVIFILQLSLFLYAFSSGFFTSLFV